MVAVSDHVFANPGRATIDSANEPASATFSYRVPENVIVGEDAFLSIMTQIVVRARDPQNQPFAWEVRVNENLITSFMHDSHEQDEDEGDAIEDEGDAIVAADEFGTATVALSRLFRPEPDNEVTVRIRQGSGVLTVGPIIAHFKVDI